MRFRTEKTLRTIPVHGGTIEQAEHSANLLVQFLRAILALLDTLIIRKSQEITVISIAGTHGEAIGPGAKLHIQPIPDGLVGVMSTSPVTHHHSIEGPVTLQYLIQSPLVMTVVLILIQVIRTHDGPRMTLLDGSLEGRQVYLVQSTVTHHHIHLMTIFLIIVQTIMLHTGRHTLGLQSLNVRNHQRGSQERILTHILKVAPVERSTQDIHARPQYHILATVESLFSQSLTIDACHLRVPRSSQAGECRKSHTGIIRLASLLPFIPKHIRTYTMRTIVSPEIRKAQTGNTSRRELTLSMYHPDFLHKRHTRKSILYALLHRFTVVQINR